MTRTKGMTAYLKQFLFSMSIAALLVSAGCNLGSRSSGPGGEEMGSEADREKAFHLIEDANENIKSIKVLYRQNNAKVDDLQAALKAGDQKKVKELSEELLLAMNDGYLFADSIVDKMEQAQALDINQTWIELQIRAFDYRKSTAELFRDKVGSEDQATLKLARDTFKKNEENFKKYMNDAEKVSKEADELRKESMRRR